MSSQILLAGFDSRGLALEAPILKRQRHRIAERPTARAVFQALADEEVKLLLLGPRLPDLGLAELIRLVRADEQTRHVSILALLPAREAPDAEERLREAGANAVLRRPLKTEQLERWLVKLLEVPRRTQLRVPVRGQVVAVPRSGDAGRFCGLTRNISVNGLLLASQEKLLRDIDVELEISLEEPPRQLRALGRVVRTAPEVHWPYLGYGVEFLLVPPDSRESIADLVGGGRPSLPPPGEAPKIRTTIERGGWVYEILDPVQDPHGWQVEIRRAPHERWRPGSGGPFYVVLGASPEAAYREARAFVERQE